MDTNILINLVKYFAKYPLKEGIIKHFMRDSDKYSGYLDLKTYISELTTHSILPELETLIISTNETKIKDFISGIEKYFLMIEYGSIPTKSPNSGSVRESTMHLSLIVGRKHQGNNLDIFEEIIEMDKMFAMMQTIINTTLDDTKDCHILKGFNESSINISPIDPAALHDTYGWWASLEKQSYTMFG